MDGLKLEQWKARFQDELKSTQIEHDAFFKQQPLKELVEIQTDASDELVLKISDQVTQELKNRLLELLMQTKPEDSV